MKAANYGYTNINVDGENIGAFNFGFRYVRAEKLSISFNGYYHSDYEQKLGSILSLSLLYDIFNIQNIDIYTISGAEWIDYTDEYKASGNFIGLHAGIGTQVKFSDMTMFIDYIATLNLENYLGAYTMRKLGVSFRFWEW